MHPIVNTAVKAARRAGTVIVRHLDRLDSLTVEKKGRADYVSEVDRMAEAEILNVIKLAYPEHSILAEESGSVIGDDFQWIIDPLDGTTNFLHGFPHFSVSIALSHKGAVQHGVIFDPLRNELFTASRGQGAHLNDRRIRVSNTSHLEHALLATGFPYKILNQLDEWLKTFETFLRKTSGVRRAGSAALDLAHVAAGRFDGFWEAGLSPWDMAAGTLLIREAGGLVCDFNGDQDFLNTGNIVAANPKIFDAILTVVRKTMPTHA